MITLHLDVPTWTNGGGLLLAAVVLLALLIAWIGDPR